jgi:hypothetical protein
LSFVKGKNQTQFKFKQASEGVKLVLSAADAQTIRFKQVLKNIVKANLLNFKEDSES